MHVLQNILNSCMEMSLYLQAPTSQACLYLTVYVHVAKNGSDCFFCLFVCFFSVALVFLPAADIPLYVSQGRSVNKSN